MWDLIPRKLMPPTRIVRYCCSILKEQGGAGRYITTGARWAESVKRKNTRGIYEAVAPKVKDRVILANDNDDRRRLTEHCMQQRKTVCNPIIDWTDDDVWDYLMTEKIPVNPLYQCGFRRVGCIGCPMAGKATRMMEFARYPKYKALYIIAFDRMLANRRKLGKETRSWQTGEDVFHWWMEDGVLPGQLELSELEEVEDND